MMEEIMKKCIGIISWLPDEPTLREKRLKSLNATLESCYKFFNLPIIIIAQNWQDSKVNVNDKCIIYKYDKLGILKARKVLREKFLTSDFDYLIMLDDDCILSGTSASSYLQILDENPNGCVRVYPTQLKLFAISKALYALVDMVDCDPELDQGYEDLVFTNVLFKKYRSKFYQCDASKIDIHLNIKNTFTNSTWVDRVSEDKSLMNTKSLVLINELCKQ